MLYSTFLGRCRVYRTPRGTTDILPQDQALWQFVKSRAAEVCRLYGYERIDTPVFEDARLFIRGIGEGTDIVEKEMYTFEDRSGDPLTLRPEGTAPVCRAYIEHGMANLPQPVRLYYIAPIFRYERPQAGRFRQHWQFGAEAIGDAAPALDAEVIDMALAFYRALGLTSLVLKINSIGCPQCRPGYLETLKAYYADKLDRVCPDCRRRAERNPLRLLDCKNETCIPLTEQAPRSTDHLCAECARHFQSLQDHLRALEHPFEVEHRLVRGLDYYTRTVFEIQPPGSQGAQSTVGGGGRYDNLIESLGGRPTPAIGFATGIERIILNLKREGMELPARHSPCAFVAFTGQGAEIRALECAARLRKAGIGTVMASPSRSLKSQLRQANALGADHAIIIGEEELRDGLVTLKEMSGGVQECLPLTEAINRLKKGAGAVRQGRAPRAERGESCSP